MEWLIGLVMIVLLFFLFAGGGKGEDAPAVELKPDPMPDLPENEKVFIDGTPIGNVTPNPTQSGWSASNADRAVHDIGSKESAIALLVRDHYRG